MKRVLIDTGAFIAQRISADQYHELASRAFAELAEAPVQLYSSEHILDETVTLLGRRESYAYAVETGEELLRSRVLRWLDAGVADWHMALRFMRKFADQAVSFTDCLTFALMKREGIKTVFGFDRHFQAAGFHVWPSRE